MSATSVSSAAATAAPDQTAFVFSSEGRGFGELATRLRAREHQVVADEPEALGGQDLGANPAELALSGLIACQAVTYRVWAKKLGIALDDVAIHADGDLDIRGFLGLDEGVRPGFSGVRLQVKLSGPEPAQRYRELQAAVDLHCPVLDLFSHATPVTTALQVAQGTA
ncbi:MAG: OsmC family peroxiredoxin [Burkholderiaceae bacterium]|nr:MAG: OsmC family peroxiredoxin [Burkholderiaceae bacterium]